MGNEKEKKQSLKTESVSSIRLLKYLEGKARNHVNFKMYSSLTSLKYRRNSEALFLSKGGNWNDVQDRNMFNPHYSNYVRFGACFSFSRSESVAMWMLYGGTKREGIMVDFKQAHMKRILNEIESVDYGVWQAGGFLSKGKLNKKDFSLNLMDVLYISESQDPQSYRVKRSDETVPAVNKKIIDHQTFIKKSDAWSYENECRLIVSVPYNKIIGNGLINSIRISIPSIYDDLINERRIYMAPNFSGNMPKFQKSALTGGVDWNLCSDCDYPVIAASAMNGGKGNV